MRLTKKKRNHSVGFNMTPMIDIVFLLIIFFMTVSQITRVVDQPMTLPVVAKGAGEGKPANVTINIVANGDIVVAGNKYSLSRTAQILRNKVSQSGNDPNTVKIELRCDKDCPSDHINRIIDELADIGFKFVKIAVTGEN